MKRRGFLGLLAGAAVAPFVPAPTVQPPIMFHKDAFTLAMEPATLVVRSGVVTRFDVLYGYGCIAPHTAVRIEA